MRNNFFLMLIICITILFSCTNTKESDLKKKFQEDQILFTIVSSSINNSSTCTKPNISCNGTNNIKSFSTLKTILTTDYSGKGNCARSGCHTGSAQFDITSYNSTINYVKSGNPECSTIFLKVYNGSMTTYSNTQIHESIYCWISNGSSN